MSVLSYQELRKRADELSSGVSVLVASSDGIEAFRSSAENRRTLKYFAGRFRGIGMGYRSAFHLILEESSGDLDLARSLHRRATKFMEFAEELDKASEVLE